jgi:hypothetical protein
LRYARSEVNVRDAFLMMAGRADDRIRFDLAHDILAVHVDIEAWLAARERDRTVWEAIKQTR